MKFVKGMLIGTIVSAGVIWMYNEMNESDKKKMMKKGKKFIKEIKM